MNIFKYNLTKSELLLELISPTTTTSKPPDSLRWTTIWWVYSLSSVLIYTVALIWNSYEIKNEDEVETDFLLMSLYKKMFVWKKEEEEIHRQKGKPILVALKFMVRKEIK